MMHVSTEQWDEMMAAFNRADKWRADQMPDQEAALRVMFEAHRRLIELGWREVIYCPRDGSSWEFCGPGSTGVHPGYRDEQGRFWVEDGGDIWPADPSLFRAVPQAARSPQDTQP